MAAAFIQENLPVLLALSGLVVTGAVILTIAASLLTLTALLIFKKTRHVLIPSLTITALNLAESPARYLLRLFGIRTDEAYSMIVELRNRVYWDAYCGTPKNQRAVFIPQCLRNPKCPAPLTPEGIDCMNCGLCGLGEIKNECEKNGVKFFIAPGSSLIKRMIKKHNPKAVVGVGCLMEVKEGVEMVASIKRPVQGVFLSYGGCVDTRVDAIRLLEVINAVPGEEGIKDSPTYLEKAKKINAMWSPTDSMEPPLEVSDKK